jgi:hypothetical protein
VIKKILFVLVVFILGHAAYQVFKSYKISEAFSDDLDTLMITVRAQTEDSFKQQVVARAEKNGIVLAPDRVSVRIEETAGDSLGNRVLSGTGARIHNKRITLDFKYEIPVYGIPLARSVHRSKVFAAEIVSPAAVQEDQIGQTE